MYRGGYNGGGGGGGGYRGGNGGYNRGYGGGGGGGGGGYGGGGGGGGYGGGGGGYNNSPGGARKRGREDDYQNDQNQRRRNDDRGGYYQGGGYGGRPSYNQRGPPAPPLPTSNQRFKEEMWKLGDDEHKAYYPESDIPILASKVAEHFARDKVAVFEGFRVAVTELPHKLTHFVALAAYLLARDSETITVGHEILANLTASLQEFINEERWRSARYIILFLTHLSAVHPVESLTPYLTTFLSILSEPSLKATRGDYAVRTVVEAILRGAGGEDFGEIKDACQSYLASRLIETEIFGGEGWEDRLELLVSTLAADGSLSTSHIITNPFSILPLPGIANRKDSDDGERADVSTAEDGPKASADPTPIPLPAITLPLPPSSAQPETSALPSKSSSAGLRGDEGVGLPKLLVFPKLFDDDSVPGPYDPVGAVLRSLIDDVVEMYEVNRKECARVLLDLRNWVAKGTFKSNEQKAVKDGQARGEEADKEEEQGSTWILEHMIVESILTSLFALPEPSYTPSYYHSLLCELCRLAPTNVARAVGKCVRRLFSNIGTSTMGPENVRRFAEWWSMHLSNFNFTWAWADWVPDMDLGPRHPKRVFVERTIELEVRLSYYDRVKGTIPEALFATGVMPDDPPSATYVYEAPEHQHAPAAAALLRLIKGKGSVEEVDEELTAFRETLKSEGQATEAAESTTRDMAIETILHVGSRSFSHFLNVLERYLPLFRSLSASASARLQLLQTVASFWALNSQFHLIVLEKLLQYRILDPADILAWVFADGQSKSWSKIDRWDALKLTVKTVLARHEAAKTKLESIVEKQKDQPEEPAVPEPRDGEDVILPDAPTSSSVPIATLQLETAQSELTLTVVEVTKQFHGLMSTAAAADADEWESWWVEGWFREFCRSLVTANAIGLPIVVAGIEGLNLGAESKTVKILDSAKAWNSFV